MNGPQEREQFLDDYLNSVTSDEEIEQELDRSQEETEMPSELSTPVSLSQKNQVVTAEKKKKKKKKKSKTANLPEAGSALADDYVEHNQEDAFEDPFDPERPLSQRVEYAIWKYRKNHKFTESRKAIFDHYLKFGGIDTGPNMFLGRATSADTTADPEDEADYQDAKLTIDSVPDDFDGEMEVNFTEVAQVYFGYTFIRETRFITMQEFIDAPNLIDAFLKYLQIRNVAPEYADDIEGARAVVAQAKIELPKCKALTQYIPGNFNKACGAYFGDESLDPDVSWMNNADMKTQNLMKSFFKDAFGMTREDAKSIVKLKIKNPANVNILDTRVWVGIKVTDIPYISPETEEDALMNVTFVDFENNRDTYSIVFEKKIVESLVEGMVTRATLCKLSDGTWYLKEATRIMPSFYMEDDFLEEENYDY
ncbi:Argonaute siRNA chaperone complex subunit Arb1-domain-containing protein [Sporodiniella umbellata]|nr:Argonaute siRNA chaperone complex subunit Arb1-domain-containing protein [Sporodiniella umbellata]